MCKLMWKALITLFIFKSRNITYLFTNSPNSFTILNEYLKDMSNIIQLRGSMR